VIKKMKPNRPKNATVIEKLAALKRRRLDRRVDNRRHPSDRQDEAD
jgi:hypothetical protein